MTAPVRRDVLTIDVEDWYHLNYDSMQSCAGGAREPRVERNTQRLLEMFAAHGAQATFFFLGSVAERYPGLVRDALAAGHEIASHGYAHELVYRQTRAEFRADVAKARYILQDITGRAVRGYRAPSWSISKDTPWVYEVLAELGFDYSASVFPFRTYLYGDGNAPVRWFGTRAGGRRFVELPATVAECAGKRVPFAGGFYFRVLPWSAIRAASRRVHRDGRAVVYYLHPREIDPEQPRLELSQVDRLVTYWGLRGCERKLGKLLRWSATCSVERYLEAEGAFDESRPAPAELETSVSRVASRRALPS